MKEKDKFVKLRALNKINSGSKETKKSKRLRFFKKPFKKKETIERPNASVRKMQPGLSSEKMKKKRK